MMARKQTHRVAWLLPGLAGAGLVVFALLAYALGFDHNPDWGTSRWLIFFGGCGLILITLGGYFRDFAARVFNWLWSPVEREIVSPVLQWAKKIGQRAGMNHIQGAIQHAAGLPVLRWFFGRRARRAFWGCLLAGGAVIWFYFWVATSGWSVIWPNTSTWYSKLGESFLQGQVSLLEKPSAEILALNNPYDLNERLQSGASYPWDVSLYGGKFFIYWGPVPALISAAVQGLIRFPIRDVHLVLLFCAGAFIFSALQLRLVWNTIGAGSPVWTLVLAVLTAGLINPLPYLLARPATYEAAIIAGQCFLLGGLYFLARALQRNLRIVDLAIAGVCIIASLGSRTSLAFALLALDLVMLLVILQKVGGWKDRTGRIAALGLPQAAGLALLLFYNHARFDSWLEFGMRYALSVVDMQRAADSFLHLNYLLPNLYAYLLHPPIFPGGFPYLESPWMTETSWPFWVRLPVGYYFSEPVLGLLYFFPGAILAVPALWMGILSLVKRDCQTGQWGGLNGWLAVTSTALLVSFITLLFFFATSMRYLTDFVPLMVLLAGAGFWIARRHLAGKPIRRFLLDGVFLILNLQAILVGVFLSFSGPNNHLLNNNPALYETLAQFWMRWIHF